MASTQLTTGCIVGVVAHLLGAGLAACVQVIGSTGVLMMTSVSWSGFAERLKEMD